MKKLIFYSLLMLSVNLNALAQGSTLKKQNNSNRANVKVKKWFDTLIDNQQLGIEPDGSININAFKEEYTANKTYWDSAFSFLRKNNLTALESGKYPIIGDHVFATISDNIPTSKNELQWESHRKYIDLHHVIKGKETIGITSSTRAKVTKEYTADIMNYQADGDFFESDSTLFFLAFPDDIHMPNIKSSGSDKVKKLVIKIEVAEQFQKKN